MLRICGSFVVANFIKKVSKKLGKWGFRAAGAIIILIIGSFAWWGIDSCLLSEQPIEPNITSSPSPNPIVNTADTQTIVTTVNPDFEPEYANDIEVTVQNDNSRTCYMVIEFRTSEGFRFLPMSDNLPDNFTVEEGYEYQDAMKIYIKDFPPAGFPYELTFSVYTMDFDTYGRTEQISWEILEIQFED